MNISITPVQENPSSLWQECSTLFNTNYATWSLTHPNPSSARRRVCLSPRLLKTLCFPPTSSPDDCSSGIATAKNETGLLIGHALYCSFPYRTPNNHDIDQDGCEKKAVWISQLVVSAAYRNSGVATSLLRHLLSHFHNTTLSTFPSGAKSENSKTLFAVGLATSHPYTIKALETATGELCNLPLTDQHARSIVEASGVPYLQGRNIDISRPGGTDGTKEGQGGNKCVIDTRFFIDHDIVDLVREGLGDEWVMGELGEGEEFLGIVFPGQTSSVNT